MDVLSITELEGRRLCDHELTDRQREQRRQEWEHDRQRRIERSRIREEEHRTGVCHDHGRGLYLCPECSPLS